MREGHEEETPKHVRAGDVGIFGLSRILISLGVIAGIFGFISQMTVDRAIAALRIEMIQFQANIAKEIPPPGQVVLRPEWNSLNDERARVLADVNSRIGLTNTRYEELEKRLRELERSADRVNGKIR